jgi:hypothetical protein
MLRKTVGTNGGMADVAASSSAGEPQDEMRNGGEWTKVKRRGRAMLILKLISVLQTIKSNHSRVAVVLHLLL